MVLLAKKTSSDFDDFLIDMATRLNWMFFGAVGAYGAVRSFDMPDVVDKALNYFFVSAIAFQAVILVNGAITYALSKFMAKNKASEDSGGPGIVRLLSASAKFLVWLIAIISVLSNLGVNVTALIGGLGVGTLAIALAVQSFLRDIVSTVKVYFAHLFEVGDFIAFDGNMGTVEKIGLTTTHLRTPQGEELIFPNSKVIDGKIQNFKNMEKRRVEFTIGVKYGTRSEQVGRIPDIIRSIIEKTEHAEFERCHFKEFGNPGLNIEVAYWVLSPSYQVSMEIRHRVNLAIKEEFEKAGIQFDRA
jgi:small-conductance mechanosensitive channel